MKPDVDFFFKRRKENRFLIKCTAYCVSSRQRKEPYSAQSIPVPGSWLTVIHLFQAYKIDYNRRHEQHPVLHCPKNSPLRSLLGLNTAVATSCSGATPTTLITTHAFFASIRTQCHLLLCHLKLPVTLLKMLQFLTERMVTEQAIYDHCQIYSEKRHSKITEKLSEMLF